MNFQNFLKNVFVSVVIPVVVVTVVLLLLYMTEGGSFFLSACVNDENLVFSILILATIFGGMILKGKNKSPRVCAFLPSLAASIGIFGTFWGIFVGLSEFDSTNIQASVPPLLEGMKTAFCTSLAGMLGSLVLKGFYHNIDDIKDFMFRRKAQAEEKAKFDEELKAQAKAEAEAKAKNVAEKAAVEEARKKEEDFTKILNSMEHSLVDIKKVLEGNRCYDILNQMNSSLSKIIGDGKSGLSYLESELTAVKGYLQGNSNEHKNGVLIDMNTSISALVNGINDEKSYLEMIKEVQEKAFEALFCIKNCLSGAGDNAENPEGISKQMERSVNVIKSDLQAMQKVQGSAVEALCCIKDYLSGAGDNAENPEGISKQMERSVNVIKTTMEEKFENFYQKFSEMASKSMVEQLQSVVGKFNATLSDLVAQSFKDLQQSTIELNRWQKEYKVMVETENENMRDLIERITPLIEKYEEAKQSMMMVSDELINIENTLQKITGSGEQLAQQGQDLADQNKQLETSLLAIVDVGETAKQVIPTISSQMTKIIDDMKLGSDSMKNAAQGISEELTSNVKKFSQQSSEFRDELVSSQQKNDEWVNQMIKRVDANMTDFLSEMNTWTNQFAQEVNEQLSASLNQIVSMLCRISNKFAEDYEPLADKLRKVMEIANNIEHKTQRQQPMR